MYSSYNVTSNNGEWNWEDPLGAQTNKYRTFLLKVLQHRREWRVQPLRRLKQKEGKFSVLFQLLRDMDKEMHFKYFPRSAGRIWQLGLSPGSTNFPLLYAQYAFRHNSESDSTVLCVYASCGSNQAVAARYRHASSTVSFLEVGKALWKAPQPELLPSPSVVQWGDTASDFWTMELSLLTAAQTEKVNIKASPHARRNYYIYKGTSHTL